MEGTTKKFGRADINFDLAASSWVVYCEIDIIIAYVADFRIRVALAPTPSPPFPGHWNCIHQRKFHISALCMHVRRILSYFSTYDMKEIQSKSLHSFYSRAQTNDY